MTTDQQEDDDMNASMRELIKRAGMNGNGNGHGEFVPPSYRDVVAQEPAATEATKAPPPDYSKNQLAQRFMEVGDAVAKSLEQVGDEALKAGQSRKDEYYKFAANVRAKAEFQAKEALDYIENLKQLQAMTAPKPKE